MPAGANEPAEAAISGRSRLLCKVMTFATAATALAIPLLVVWSLWNISDARLAQGLGDTTGVGVEIGSSTANLVRMLLALPSLVMSYALLLIARFFRALSKSQAFDPATYGHLRKFAIALALNVLASIIVRILTGFVIDASTPNDFPISLQFGTPQIFTLGTAILAYVLARVLSEACALEDENRLFV